MHLLHVFPSFQVGGSQRRFAALANHFAKNPARDFLHSVVALDGCFDAAKLLDPEVRVALRNVGPKTGTLAGILRARRLLHQLRPDVLITYNWGAVEWAAASGRLRHIHIEDGFGPEEAERQLRRRVLFRRFVLNRHALVVLPSQTLVRLATDCWRIAPERVVYLPNGVACRRFVDVADALPAVLFSGTGPVIGTVAALRKEKALERLIEAFAAVLARRPARLVIVGDGAERPMLERLAARLNVASSVTFTGALARPEQALAAFDVFAISSNTEQMPLSVLEAMAAGLPIAATDAGDIRAMIAEENQAFVVAKETHPLADAIERLLTDATLSQRLGAANRARALARFDENRMFAAYERLFMGEQILGEQTMGEGRPPVPAATTCGAAAGASFSPR